MREAMITAFSPILFLSVPFYFIMKIESTVLNALLVSTIWVLTLMIVNSITAKVKKKG